METVDSADLVVLDQFERALAAATTLEEVRAIRNKADAVRHLAKHARMSLEVQNRAAEVKLRAERKAGRLLAQLKLRGGHRTPDERDGRPRLSDLGITQNESKRWQRQASIPEEDFQYYVRRATEFGEELTAAGLLRLARGLKSRHAADRSRNGSGAHRSCATGEEPIGQRAARGEAENASGQAAAADRLPRRSADEFTALLSELFSHHALLCQMLAPICHGEQDSWLPGQRRGTWHYLSEIGRLLVQLTPIEPTDEEE